MARKPKRPPPKRGGTLGSDEGSTTAGAGSGGDFGPTAETAPVKSPLEIIQGWRRVKSYPLTESELHGLASIGIGATICFSAATGFLGVAFDIHKDLALATGVPNETAAFWGGARIALFVASVAFAIIGVVLIWLGRTRLSNIKSSTAFDAPPGTTNG